MSDGPLFISLPYQRCTGQDTMKVAIVGAGPAGLSAAIELGRVPGVELAVFEKATELREIGAVSRRRELRGHRPRRR